MIQNSSSSALVCFKMMAVGLEFSMRGFKKKPGCGGRRTDKFITHYVRHITGTVVRNDSNNNCRDVSIVRGDRNNKLTKVGGRKISRGFCMGIVNWRVVKESNE